MTHRKLLMRSLAGIHLDKISLNSERELPNFGRY